MPPTAILQDIGILLVSTIKMGVVLTLIMVVLEFLKEGRTFERIQRFLMPLSRLFNMSHKALIPLFVGFIFGILNGSGVLKQYAHEGVLKGRDKALVALFISTCHAFIEDSMLFVVVGGWASWIFGTRLAIAVLITAAAGHGLAGRWLLSEQRGPTPPYSDGCPSEDRVC